MAGGKRGRFEIGSNVSCPRQGLAFFLAELPKIEEKAYQPCHPVAGYNP